MKQNLIVLFFTLQFITAYSQHTDEYGFDYELRNGTAVLVPSWNNIFNTFTMPDTIFSELMDVYGYEFISDKNYWWKMDEVADCDFFIQKDIYSLSFIWKNTTINLQELKDKFDKYFIEKLSNGMKIYAIKIDKRPPFEIRIWDLENIGLVSFELKL